jgi:hypothetical protein
MPAPTDVTGVKRVLGLVQYLAKFIPNLSDVSDPLRILVKNDVQWHWNREQQQSFDELKRLVSVHRYYLKEKPYLACRKYTFPYPERTRYANHTVATSLTYVEDAV